MIKINKETSRKTILRLHRALWLWIQKFPDKEKYEWPGWGSCNPISNDCFLCEYTFLHKLPCDECFIDWGTIINHCNAYGSPFRRYSMTNDLSKKAYYAGKIANLKVREEHNEY